MERIIDLLHFLICLDVFGVSTGGDFSNFIKSKKI